MRGQTGYNTRRHARLPSSFLGMDVWITSQLNIAFIRRLCDMLGLLLLTLSMDIRTTIQWQTFGRLVQELNV